MVAAAKDSGRLAALVRVFTPPSPAVNVERDGRSAEAVQGYSLGEAGLTALRRMFHGGRPQAPAWTLTGPFGAGKSHFAVFLAALLWKEHPAHGLAMDKLRAAEPELVPPLVALPSYDPVFVTARPTTPLACLQDALRRREDLPARVRQLLQGNPVAASPADPSSPPLQALRYLAGREGRGLLLVIDELGKLLEFAAQDPERGDLYLLQQLAELRADGTVLVLGVLHQAFAKYAHPLDRPTRGEWEKIQGRFRDIAFVNSPGFLMRLLGEVIQADAGAGPVQQGRRLCRELARALLCAGAVPERVAGGFFLDLAERAFPLHPLSLAVLPHLFQEYGQNERSLGVFFAAAEPAGFQEFLHHTPAHGSQPALFGLPEVFDYLVTALRGVLHLDRRLRPVAVAHDRLRREVLAPAEAAALKVVACLQWVGHFQALRPDLPTLEVGLAPGCPDAASARQVLESLQRRSVLVHRAFNGTYAVWEGSNIDLGAELAALEGQRVGRFAPALLLERLLPLAPRVAHRHTMETGSLRAFQVRYVDRLRLDLEGEEALARPSGDGFAGTVWLVLAQQAAERAEWERRAQQLSGHTAALVVGVPGEGAALAAHLAQLDAVSALRSAHPDVARDPVVQRELEEREELLRQEIVQRLEALWRTCRWFALGERQPEMGVRFLSRVLSRVCDRVYRLTPIVRNELVNRWSLSTAAAAARRTLIEGILERGGQERLGIQGYPPERAVYESVFLASGLHRQEDLVWGFFEPPEEDPLRWRPVWERLKELVFAEPLRLLPVDELGRELCRPPFGLTPGLFPLLLCAFLQVHRNETSLYRNQVYLPLPGVADWEVLLRRPELFAVAGCRVDGGKGAFLRAVAAALGTPAQTVAVARELVRRYRRLPEFTRSTARICPAAAALRQAIAEATSPEALVFRDLPAALAVAGEGVSPSAALTLCLRDLEGFFRREAEAARDALLAACGLPPGPEGWRELRRQAAVLLGSGLVQEGRLLPFVTRAAGGLDGNEEQHGAALESVLALVAGRPLRDWRDRDAERFPAAAAAYGTDFRRAVLACSLEESLSQEERAQRDALLPPLQRELARSPSAKARLAALLALLTEEWRNAGS